MLSMALTTAVRCPGHRTDRGRDPGDGGVDVADRARDRVERGTRLVGEGGTGLDLAGPDLHRLDRRGDHALDLADEPGDLLGGTAGALGELADLVGDDREALPHLARPGSLDGGVEGEEVGLLGDVVDRLDDRADLLGLGGDLGDLAGRVLDGALDPVHPATVLRTAVAPWFSAWAAIAAHAGNLAALRSTPP